MGVLKESMALSRFRVIQENETYNCRIALEAPKSRKKGKESNL
jgi:hypothetical protein